MKSIMKSEAIKTITTHSIDGGYVESYDREVMDLINPTTAQVIGHVAPGDEEDARRAIAAAKRAFATFGRSTKEERSEILRRLHEVVSARIDDLTVAMVEEYGGFVQFAAPLVQAGAHAFLVGRPRKRQSPIAVPATLERLGRLERKKGTYEGACT